jgi:ribosomal protein S18 acetylase RimI-like enzyme
MESALTVEELHPGQWMRLRDIRLAALENDGFAFGGNLEVESAYEESAWREKFKLFSGVIAQVDGVDIGFMSVENLKGDFGATCWIGSCWIRPEYRGTGVLKSLFDFVDERATDRDWLTQGLGVWVNNEVAIRAYEKIGFEKMGEKQESTRKPGMYYQRMIRKTVVR